MGTQNYLIQKNQNLYHFIFLIILFLSNINYINTSKSIKRNLINYNLLSKRNLDEILKSSNDNEYIYESDQICSSISKELKQYYSTGDLSQLDLDKNIIDSTDITETLISFAQKRIYKDSHYSSINEYEKKEINIQEILSRFKYVILFLIIFFISFIFWFVFCCNVCCNCCCCKCCCYKPCCINPCFIFLFILYLVVIAMCIFSFININKTIEGFYDTQCSYLYFFESILYGEKKETKPKWVGIEQSKNILNDLKDKLYYLNENSYLISNLYEYKSSFNKEKNNFFLKLKNVHKKFYKSDEITPQDGYSINYPNTNEYFFQNASTKLYLKNKYYLDIIKLFGKYHENNQSFSGYISLWNKEFSENNNGVNNAMDKFRTNLENLIFNGNGNYYNEIKNAIIKLENLKTPLENIYKKRLNTLNTFHKNYGSNIKLVLYITFGILSLSSSSLLTILLLIFYKKICDCTCLNKFFIHFLWNILSLFMIISFIFSTIFLLLNILSNEMISIFSYIISPENFGKDNPYILDIFNESKDILEECFLREGNLTKIFDLEELRYYLNNIIEAKKEIKKYIDIFNNISINHPSYNFLKSILDNKTEFNNDTYIYHFNSIYSSNNNIIEKIKLDDALKLLNDSIGNYYEEKWDKYRGDKNTICGKGTYNDFINYQNKEKILLNPWFCEPIDRDWILLYSNNIIKNYALIVSDIIDLLKYANSTKNPGINGFENYFEIINVLKNDYNYYLRNEIDILKIFEKKDYELVDILEKGIGLNNNDSFSFLEGKFINNNFNILLNNLKNSFGKDFYVLSICFLSIGLLLIFAIPSTLLFLSLFNDKDQDKNQIPKIVYKKITEKEKIETKNDDENTEINIESYDAESIKERISLLKDEITVTKFKINLIFFYEEMSNENKNIYNRLKLQVLGGFFGVKKIDILKKLFQKLEEENASFILITTGSSFKNIKELCDEYNFIKHVIIFCMDTKTYKEKYNSKQKVDLITNDITEINDYLKNKSDNDPDYDKRIKKLISHNPLISYYEYINYYYIFHKILSFFFKEDLSELNYSSDYKKIMFTFIEFNSGCNSEQKQELKNIITNIYNSNEPLKDFLEFYTDETDYIYIFNRIMRKIEEGVARLSFLIGPMYYSMVRFVKIERKDLNLNKSIKLYRNIEINEYDLNIYEMAQNKIICFSSFTSTSKKNNEFKTTKIAKKVNNIVGETITLQMILKYTHNSDNAPVGMILDNYSVNKQEAEVLLFPFTFIKVNELKKIDETFYELSCDIINKKSILEFGLKNGKKVDIKDGYLITA